MATVQLDGNAIADWASFHAASRAAFGFPDTYGATLDAWVDCMSYLRDADSMSRFRLAPSEVLTIEVRGAAGLRARRPEIVEELEACVAFLNDRYADYGEQPALRLVLA